MMSDAVLIALITGVVSTIASCIAAYVSIRNIGKKLEAAKAEVAVVKHIALDTSHDVRQITTGAFTAGFLQGQAQERRKSSDLGTLE